MDGRVGFGTFVGLSLTYLCVFLVFTAKGGALLVRARPVLAILFGMPFIGVSEIEQEDPALPLFL